MLKKIVYAGMILTFCLAPLTGCDPQSATTTTPATPTPAATATTSQKPVHLNIDSKICQVKVDSVIGDDGKQDFVMNVVCNEDELFSIDIDGQGKAGVADGVKVNVFGRDFLNWGTKK